MELTDSKYYSNEADIEFMSYSQFKAFDECPAKAMAVLKGEWAKETTDSMLLGAYVDSWLDGNIGEFQSAHPEIFNSRTGELKAPFKQAVELCSIINEDDYLLSLLKGERQKIITGMIAGVKFKGKIDSLHEDCIVDGKVLKDCEDGWKNGEKVPFYKLNDYDKQAAIYQWLYMQETGKTLPFRLAVVTKEKQPDKRVFEFSQKTIDDAMQMIIAKAPVFDAMKQGKEEVYGCGCCDYCKSIKKLNKNDVEVI